MEYFNHCPFNYPLKGGTQAIANYCHFWLFSGRGAWKRGSNVPGALRRQAISRLTCPRITGMTRMGKRQRRVYSCDSCDSWATDLAPAMSGATFTIPFCLQGFSTVGSRGVAPFPQGMSAYVEHLAGTKPESFARGSYVRSAGWRTVPVCLAFGPKPSLSRQSLPATAEAQSLKPASLSGFLRASVPLWFQS